MKAQYRILAALSVIVSAGLLGCSKSTSKTSASNGAGAGAAGPAAEPAAPSYSGPLTDLKQLDGTWVNTSAHGLCEIMTFADDGKASMNGITGWNPDGTPIWATPDVGIAKVLHGSKVGIHKEGASVAEGYFAIMEITLDGPNLTVTGGNAPDHFRRLAPGETADAVLKSERPG